MVSVGDGLHEAPGFGEELVGFGSALDDTWFRAIEATRQGVLSDSLKEEGVDVFGFPGVGLGLPKNPRPRLDEIQRSLEAEFGNVEAVGHGSLPHEPADEVVGDEEHGDFLFDHGRGKTTQDLHAHGGFEVAKTQFDSPTQTKQVCQGGGGIGLGIQQRGDQGDNRGAEPRDENAEADLP